MTIPKSIISIATLGTENRSIEPETLESASHYLGENYGSGGIARQILTTTAGLVLRKRAGWKPPIVDEPLPDPCPPETLKSCSRTAADMMIKLFHIELPHDKVLYEWFNEIEKRGQRIPSEYLAMILKRGQADHALRKHIAPVLGKRGEWLVESVPHINWLWFRPHNVEQCWSEGSLQARTDLIEVLRGSDPDMARELVSRTWDHETSAGRENLLAKFAIGLSMADEPFLMTALMDTSENVRKKARTLLVQLPESDYGREIERRAAKVFRRTYNGKAMKVALHDLTSHDNSYQEIHGDKYLWKDARKYQQSMNRSALYLIYTSIRYWLKEWNLGYETFFEAVKNNREQASAIWVMLKDSAEYHKDQESAEALMPYANRYLTLEQRRSLYECMSKEQLEAEAIALLENSDDGSHLAYVSNYPLFMVDVFWSEALTQAVMASLRQHLRWIEVVDKSEDQLENSLFQHFAACIPLSAAESFMALFHETSLNGQNFEYIRRGIGNVIALRIEVHNAIGALNE